MPYRADSTKTYTAGNQQSAWGLRNREGSYGVGAGNGPVSSGTQAFAPNYQANTVSQSQPTGYDALSVTGSAPVGARMSNSSYLRALQIGSRGEPVGLPSRSAYGGDMNEMLQMNPQLMQWLMGMMGGVGY